MSMTGEGYKQSPRAKAAVDRALKMMSEGKSDRAPTREETQARQAAGRKAQESIDRITAKRDAANLPSLQKRRADMESTYSKGKDWQYADREQNLSDDERTSRDMRGNMNQLSQKIENVKKYGYKQGGKAVKLASGGNAAYAADMAAMAQRYQQQAAAKQINQSSQKTTYAPAPSYVRAPTNNSQVASRALPSVVNPVDKMTIRAATPVAKVVAPPAPVARAPIAAPEPKAPPPRAPSGPTASEKAAEAAAIKQAAAQKAAQAQQEAAAKALADEAQARAERAKTPPVVPKAPTSYSLGAVNKPRSAYKEGGKVSTHIRSKSSPNW